MLFIDLPLNGAEEVAAVRSAKHLSLDKEVKLLGHVEETTGASLVRSQSTTILNVLGTPVTTNWQLDGTGLTVAVVDSGIYEGHYSFLDASMVDRVIKHVDFTTNSSGGNYSTNRDLYGHGSHVAGLLAGGRGRFGELTQYKSVAPNAKLINVRVLGSNGTGTSSALLQGLDWLFCKELSALHPRGDSPLVRGQIERERGEKFVRP